MLLTVLMLGGAILTTSVVAGYLMVLKIRASSDIANSAKAIFSADSGIECELYRYNFANPRNPRNIDCDRLSFDDGQTSVATEIVYDASSTPQYIKSIGSSRDSKRAFIMKFTGATTILP